MTFDVIKKQLTELIDDRKSLALKDAEHDEIYLKDIEALENAIQILDYNESLRKSFKNLWAQLTSEQQATVTESCPHCDTEISVKWLPSEDGHSIYCPKCGKRIMLCSECPARDGDMECDWLDKEPPCCSWDNIEGKKNG